MVNDKTQPYGTRYLWLALLFLLASCGGGGGGSLTTTTTVTIKSSSIAPGDTHTCAALTDGTVNCWGDNSYGELGNDPVLPRAFSPIPVPGITNAQVLSSGGSYTCALLNDGTVGCWGSNISGQLGDGTTTNSFTMVKVSGLTGVTAITTSHARLDSYGHTCALKSDGTVWCWGRNIVGQLGNATIVDSSTPVPVSGLAGVTAISAGGWHTCALVGGSVMCWGDNTFGQLGINPTTTYSTTPVAVPAITTATAIAMGGVSSCALLADKTVQCWGNNGNGRLGNGTTTDSFTPVPVTGISTAISITAGRGHGCAVLTGGTVQCWGDNSAYMLGDGTAISSSIPVNVTGLAGAVSVTAGSTQTCARLTDTSVKCWGDNANAQVGPGSTTYATTPSGVLGYSSGTGVISTATGSIHACGLYGSTNDVSCWGDNGLRQLGSAAFARSSTANLVSGISAPVAAPTLSTPAITSGGWHSCTLRTDGSIDCWGDNAFGQLGNGTTITSAAPVVVSGIINTSSTYYSNLSLTWLPITTTTKAISAGSARTCAIIEQDATLGVCSATACPAHSITDTVQCWGDNDQGQLGNGTTSLTPSTTPVNVTGITTATAIEGGYNHSCALLNDGTVQCWGANYSGQLGNGTTTSSSTPVPVSGITTAIGLGVGNMNDHSCAVMQDSTVQCWGDNSLGQLGNGTLVNSSTPVTVQGLSNVSAVADGYGHSCAVIVPGTSVKCWGWNIMGQLGDGTTKNSSVPVTVTGLPPSTVGFVSSISVGFAQTCATMTNGGVQCWGDNSYAQLGRGARSTSILTPAAISIETRTSNYPSCDIALIATTGPTMCVLNGNLVIRTPMGIYVFPLPPQ